jgi:hypothetical protein
MQIIFYSGEETLVKVEKDKNRKMFRKTALFEDEGGRVEIFEIAKDERLIGCELYECTYYF